MKKSITIISAFIFAIIICTAGCKPNGNNNSTDVHNSMGEGVDTTHPIDNDSTHADTLNTKPARK